MAQRVSECLALGGARILSEIKLNSVIYSGRMVIVNGNVISRVKCDFARFLAPYTRIFSVFFAALRTSNPHSVPAPGERNKNPAPLLKELID